MAEVARNGRRADAEFRLLGDFAVHLDGAPTAVAGANLRLVLAMLALRRGRVVATDALGEELWGAQPTVDVAGSLQALVSRARRALGASGARIAARPGGYVLERDGTSTDVDAFAALAGRGHDDASAGRAREAADAFRAALECWRGPALAEFAEREFARGEAARLDEERARVTEALAQALLDAGSPADAVAVLEPHVAAHPFREDACARLMLALYRAGRRADALAAYRSARQRIADELGLDPGAELRRVEALVLAGSPELDAQPLPGSAAEGHGAQLVAPAHRLPHPVGHFVGREIELAELTALLATERLVTLWGPGGVGKTRLSLELAGRTADRFADGACFAALAGTREADLVAAAAMTALGLLGAPGEAPLDTVVTYLRTRQVLLILDNCEHVLDGAAALAHALLTHCPDVTLIATSREPLAAPAECVWPARSLSLPRARLGIAGLADSDAAALFTHRARLAKPSFAVTEENAAEISDICRRLDGIPLALELAAARVRALGVQGVTRGLDDRFSLLDGGYRSADPRHQTLRAAVDWSYDLCTPPERELLACLSVFPGDFDAAAAAAVYASETRDVPTESVLTHLVDRSLVLAADTPTGPVRYRLLETIRHYAAARLDSTVTDAVRTRHLQYFAWTRLPPWEAWSNGTTTWADLQTDGHNFRAAIEWALTIEDAASAMRFGAQLWAYWSSMPSPDDTPLAWLDRILHLPGPASDHDRALTLVGRGWYTSDPSSVAQALELAGRVGDPHLRAVVDWLAGGVISRTDNDAARRHVESALARVDVKRMGGLLPNLHHRLTWIALAQGDIGAARNHAAQAVALLSPEVPNPFDAQMFGTLAVTLAIDGAVADAEAAARQALVSARAHAVPGILLMALVWAATAAVFTANWPAADERLRELLTLLRRLATTRWAGDTLQLTALMLEATGRPTHTRALLDAADRYHRQHNETPAGGIAFIVQAVAALRGRLDAAGLAAPTTETGTLDEVLTRALQAIDSPAQIPVATRVTTPPAHHLPVPVGRFLGRESELAELAELLRSERLLTLWGPGGAGKTRLSIELAHRSLGDFPDGAWFVELAPLNAPELVATAAMSALGMVGAPVGDPVDALATYLTSRHALVVLDNCEHVLDATAHVVHTVSTRCPGVRIVATSREPLAVPGETVWSVRTLSLPPEDADVAGLADSDAVTLFLHRARAADPTFVLTEANGATVAEICHRLDGLPLALELAAVRVRALGVAGVAAGLDDRFRLLDARHRGTDTRHRTLRATVDWSYDLLTSAERSLLDALSVFPGTFDAVAAAAVGPVELAGTGAIDALTTLVDRSLVGTVPLPDGSVRYRLLDTIRHYAADHLADAGLTRGVRDRHLAHFSGPMLPWYEEWFLGRLDWLSAPAERENLRAAVEWALVRPDPHAAVRLCANLFAYWSSTDYPGDTPRSWLEAAVQLSGLPSSWGTALTHMALAWFSGDMAQVEKAMTVAENLPHPWRQGIIYWVAAGVSSRTDLAAAHEHLDRAEAIGYRPVLGSCQHLRSWLALAAGDSSAARVHAERALELISPERPRWLEAWFVSSSALMLAIDGEPELARDRSHAGLAGARELDLPIVLAMCLTRAAQTSMFLGDWAETQTHLAELLVLLHRLGTRRYVADALEVTALTLEATGRPASAPALFGAVAGHRHHDETPCGGIPAIAEKVAAARGRLAAHSATSPRDLTDTASLDEILRIVLDALAGS